MGGYFPKYIAGYNAKGSDQEQKGHINAVLRDDASKFTYFPFFNDMDEFHKIGFGKKRSRHPVTVSDQRTISPHLKITILVHTTVSF